MTANSVHFSKTSLIATTLVAALLLTSCAAQRSAPQQVQASNPTITYKYRNDDELVQANQRASTFCSQYQYAPRTTSFTDDPDGSKVVAFECVAASPSISQRPYNPNLSYTYRSDQELLSAAQNAQTYCESNGSRQVTSNTVTNANGTRTVSFQCSRG